MARGRRYRGRAARHGRRGARARRRARAGAAHRRVRRAGPGGGRAHRARSVEWRSARSGARRADGHLRRPAARPPAGARNLRPRGDRRYRLPGPPSRLGPAPHRPLVERPRAHFRAAAMQGRGIPTVVDAEALTLWSGLAERPLVFTPHLGEFRALVGDHLADEAANDRWAAAAKAAQKVRGAVLLKGVPTVIADVRGPLRVVAAGNPGLATGGSGDLLAGFIGAFLARGTVPVEAAALGAPSH